VLYQSHTVIWVHNEVAVQVYSYLIVSTDRAECVHFVWHAQNLKSFSTFMIIYAICTENIGNLVVVSVVTHLIPWWNTINIDINICTVLILARMPFCSGGHEMKFLQDWLFV